jgi:hypothetical protein
MVTFSIRIVADFKAQTFQVITELCTKILTLNLALKPLLFLYSVSNWLSYLQLYFFLFGMFVQIFIYLHSERTF